MTSLELQEGIAERQISFRVENEKIQAGADALALVDPIPFVCECADAACFDLVNLSFDAYETIRQDPRRFFNVTGHESAAVAAGAERVVAVADLFTVVEKIGVAGDVAAEAERPAAEST